MQLYNFLGRTFSVRAPIALSCMRVLIRIDSRTFAFVAVLHGHCSTEETNKKSTTCDLRLRAYQCICFCVVAHSTSQALRSKFHGTCLRTVHATNNVVKPLMHAHGSSGARARARRVSPVVAQTKMRHSMDQQQVVYI